MTPAEAIAQVKDAFQGVPRPEVFRRGTCGCEECQEHDQTLRSHTPDTISLDELGNAGWDPMCMANDHAFAYYLPGMVRLAFEDPYYVDQLMFHLNSPGRAEYLTPEHGVALRDALWAVVETMDDAPRSTLDLTHMEQTIHRLERLISGEPPSVH